MANATDIKWIKSVTRDEGAEWAYTEFSTGDIFPLNFSKNKKWYPTNYIKAQPGELMVLFQSLLPAGNREEGWYITHLVTPINRLIRRDGIPSHPYTRDVLVVGTPTIPYQVNKAIWSFFKCNRGQICTIETIEKRNQPGLAIVQKQNYVWHAFDNLLPDTDNAIDFVVSPTMEDDETFMEGAERAVLRTHKFYERDPKAIKKAKTLAKKENRLFCEACSFNFSTVYPELGDDFIECHHRQPIAIGGMRRTTVQDLAIVCSNCHRMLHRKYRGRYLLVDELKQLFFS
ncbi:hypothetical protein A3860_26705 [Niastella vici]|uniref:HNH domain-containing protein n=1 Tax=Niastella vici TaxID=1703345 RepID=A0A1V9FX27_9BACT|nr:HNH endonuclease [Niastella vici]OQP62902.1 hypothetical protein A3860_26705 [Niastella vici]